MDMITIASFVAFFALVLAWMAAPSGVKRSVSVIEPVTVGAD